MKDKIQVFTLNYRNTPVELRERLSLTREEKEALKELLDEDIKELVYLFTCNRIEFYVFGSLRAKYIIADFVRTIKGDEAAGIFNKAEEFYDRDAVLHAFKVASSLDSMVLGEPQIVGQFKDAFEEARSLGLVGPILNQLFTKALTVSKRVRTRTGIGEASISVSHVACDLAERIFGSLKDCKALLVGAGEMAELAAVYLKERGVMELIVVNRTYERGLELASKLGAIARPFEDLVDVLCHVDIVISSTSAPGYVITKKIMETVAKRRKYKPIFLIDIAVPRDVEKEVTEIDNVYLYDVDDLEAVVEENRKKREKEAQKAMIMINEELVSFMRWFESQDVLSFVGDIRVWVESVRTKELQKTLSKLCIKESEMNSLQEYLDAMTKAIVNKIMHPLMAYVKGKLSEGKAEEVMRLLREIYGGGIYEDKDRDKGK